MRVLLFSSEISLGKNESTLVLKGTALVSHFCSSRAIFLVLVQALLPIADHVIITAVNRVGGRQSTIG